MKGLLIHELVDGIREMVMQKRYLRRNFGKAMADEILPNVIKELNLITNNLKMVKVAISDEDFAEVTLLDYWNNTKRHTVDLMNHKCSCRAWQVTGKPCWYALTWILTMCMNTIQLPSSEQLMQMLFLQCLISLIGLKLI